MERSEGVLLIITSSLVAGMSGFFAEMAARTVERWKSVKADLQELSDQVTA